GDALQSSVQRPPESSEGDDDVAHAPRVGMVVEDFELDRQVLPHRVDGTIDPTNECLQHGSCLLVDQVDLVRRDPIETKRSMDRVGDQMPLAENLGKPTVSAAPKEVHLPETIL